MHKSKVQVCVYNMNKLVNVKLERGKERCNWLGGWGEERKREYVPVLVENSSLGQIICLLGP